MRASLIARVATTLAYVGCNSGAAAPREDVRIVAAGWFTAGCPRATDRSSLLFGAAGCAGSHPPRRVWISAFEIDRLEATLADYQRCVDGRACRALPAIAWSHWASTESAPRRARPDTAAEVPYEDALVYCRWRGMRLPTVAEWEKAARGLDDRVHPWGDEAPSGDRGSADGECPPPGVVGQHPAGRSPYGVDDLGGNAGEWTSDWWGGYGEFGGPMADVPADAFMSLELGDGTILSILDWTARQFTWPDRPVDPKGRSDQVQLAGREAGHTIKGACDSGGQIGLNRTIHSRMFAVDERATPSEGWRREKNAYLDVAAGFRCVRPLPGPPPPTIETPAPGESAFPFREPGFENPVSR